MMDVISGRHGTFEFTVGAHSLMYLHYRQQSATPHTQPNLLNTRFYWSVANNEHKVGIAFVSWPWKHLSRLEEPQPEGERSVA